jgi:hypothetical protein
MFRQEKAPGGGFQGLESRMEVGMKQIASHLHKACSMPHGGMSNGFKKNTTLTPRAWRVRLKKTFLLPTRG